MAKENKETTLTLKEVKKAFFEMMVPDHKSNRDKERNKMWEDFCRILKKWKKKTISLW